MRGAAGAIKLQSDFLEKSGQGFLRFLTFFPKFFPRPSEGLEVDKRAVRERGSYGIEPASSLAEWAAAYLHASREPSDSIVATGF